ncbi:transposase, partial [Nocardia amamiensis]
MSTSGYYEWKHRGESARARADRQLTATITDIHTASRGTYGAPRVHAELRLGRDIRVGRKRVARLMCSAGLAGVFRRNSASSLRSALVTPSRAPASMSARLSQLNRPVFRAHPFPGEDGQIMPAKYDAATRAKAVRLVVDHREDYA